MANTAFDHASALTLPGTTTNNGLVRWGDTSAGSFGNITGITSDGSNLTLLTRGEIRFSDADSSHYIALESPATVSTSYTMTLPADLPAANEVLTVTSYSSGAGVLEWAAASSGPSQATQAALEAETNEDTYAPPDLIKHSPGVAKAYCSVASDGTLQSNSYNLTSYARNSTGNYTVTWATDFDNTNYSAHVNAEDSSYFARAGVPATGTQAVNIRNTSGVAADSAHNITAFGDQ